MGNPQQLDPYGGGVGEPTASHSLLRWILRGVGVLIGLGIALYGVALYVLRCFDYCPTDPAEDTIIRLVAGSVFVFGVVIAIASGFVGTRWSTKATAVIAIGGVIIAFAGAISLALVPAIDLAADRAGAAAIATIVAMTGIGTGLAGNRLRRRTRADQP